MQNNIHFNPLSGKIKCPLAIAWISFFMQLYYNYHLHEFFYISYLEVIFSVFLLFSFQAIAVLLSLSNNIKNYELFFKISFILSIVNIFVNLLSVTVILLAFLSKLRVIIQPTAFVEISSSKAKIITGIIYAVIKVIETIPFFVFLCYKRKLFKGKGQINMPEMTEDNNSSIMDSESENI